MTFLAQILWVVVLLTPGSYQVVPGSMDGAWNEGAQDCAANAPAALQVHPYNSRTFILRESLCATFEAPFLYLLVGSRKALLIDTGDVADPKVVPLSDTVMGLLPGNGPEKLPLLIVHTHRHLDHRAGDTQFRSLPNVQIVGFDIESVRHFYNLADWPRGAAQIDLGDRILDVIPSPGHNETEVSFYDRNTGLFFSGDFLMPGRLLVDNARAYVASAERAASFVRDRPVSFVLGGHIEVNAAGQTFLWESRYHPHEHVLQMSKDDLLALPAALRSFNGFFAVRGQFIMEDTAHILFLSSAVVAAILAALVWMLVRYIRRRKRTRRARAEHPVC